MFNTRWSLVIGALVASLSHGLGQEPSLTWSPGQLSLRAQGQAGRPFALETSASLAPADWTSLLAGQFSGEGWSWPLEGKESARFFRLRLSALEPRSILDFRLTDHLGVSHDISYQEDQAAVVLYFADEAMIRDSAAMAKLSALRDEFAAKKVVFWVVNADQGLARPSLAEAAKAGGMPVPVLYQGASPLALELGVAVQGTAIVIDPKDKREVYRGPIQTTIDGREVPALREALAHWLEKKPISLSYIAHPGKAIALPSHSSLTFTKDVAPILIKNCVGCHSAGNIAPFELSKYEVVRDMATPIKEEVLAQRMPPWHADPEYGKFMNAAALAPEDAAKLISWINQGAPRGEGDDPLVKHLAERPSQGAYPRTWPAELGPPDYVISIPEHTIPASGNIDYVYETVTPNLPEGVWVRAAIILPGNTKVVHHCLTFDGTLLQFLGGLNGFFAGYVPGTQALPFPEGTGKWLPKGRPITFQMHYTTSGEVEKDQTKLGIYVSKQKPARELKTEAAFNVFDINIAPNAWDYEVRATKTFARDSFLYELSPHMHYRGSRFRYEVIYPDNSREVLLNVPKYYFDWQLPYRFAEPKRLPAGSRLQCVGAYDNTKYNHENPDPSARVRFGDQSDDEMFVGYVNYSDAN